MKIGRSGEWKCSRQREQHMQRTTVLSTLQKYKDLVCGWSIEFGVGSVERLGQREKVSVNQL